MEKEKFTSEYHVGDTVALDDERFTYVGTQYDELNRCTVYIYMNPLTENLKSICKLARIIL